MKRKMTAKDTRKGGVNHKSPGKRIEEGRTIRPFCGAVAVAAITGLDAEVVENGFAIERSREHAKPLSFNISGVYNYEVDKALKRHGYEAHAFNRYRDKLPSTLRRFFLDVKWRKKMWEYESVLINVTGHYVMFNPHEGTVTDTYRKAGVPWRDYPKLKWHIEHVWMVRREK